MEPNSSRSDANDRPNATRGNGLKRFQKLGSYPFMNSKGKFDVDLYKFPQVPPAFLPFNSNELTDLGLADIDVNAACKIFAIKIGASIEKAFFQFPPLDVIRAIARKFMQMFPDARDNFARVMLNPAQWNINGAFRDIEDFMLDKLTKWRSAYSAQQKRTFLRGGSMVLDDGQVVKEWQYRGGKSCEKLTATAKAARIEHKNQLERKKAEKRSTRIKLAESESAKARLEDANAKLEQANADLLAQLDAANLQIGKLTNEDGEEPFRMNFASTSKNDKPSEPSTLEPVITESDIEETQQESGKRKNQAAKSSNAKRTSTRLQKKK